MATPPPNLEFSRLSSSVSLYTPPSEHTSSSSTSDPTTILIAQWMGVSPRSRAINATYTKYHTLYPSARILTLRSLSEFFFTVSTASRLSSFKPAVTAVQADPAPNPRILVHLFSNGGALSFVDVCNVYKKSTGKVLPVTAIVLDSAPGQPTLKEQWEAMRIGLPKGILWYPAAVAMAGLLGVGNFGKYVFGQVTLVDSTSAVLNDWEVVDRRAKRLYVFSEADRLVGFKDVEGHAQEAEKAGVEVILLKEIETPHVQHMIKDAERYWEKVQELWRSTVA